MTITPRQRWMGYGVAGALTVAAMVWVGQPEDGPVLAVPTRMANTARSTEAPIGTPAAAWGAGPTSGAAAPALPLPMSRVSGVATADPFSDLHDDAATLRAEAAARPAILPLAAPSAPPLPFTFLGKWTENGRTSVILQRDDRSVAVSGPGPIKGQSDYTVQAIEDRRIVLRYVPLGTTSSLAFEAPATRDADRQTASASSSSGNTEPDAEN